MAEAPFIFMVAGEESGDQAAAQVVSALKDRWPEARILAVGGARMREAGAEILFDSSELAVMGFAEVVAHLPRLLRRRRQARRFLKKQAPDLFIPVDAPGFNIPLCREARRRGVPVLYYVAPQVWAWGAGRLKAMRRDLTALALILPFEEDWFRARGIEARFVGHPLAGRYEACAADREPTRIGLMPGSRAQELSRHLPVMLEAASLLRAERPELRFSVLETEAISTSIYSGYIDQFEGDVKLFRGDGAGFFGGQDLLWACSGTATLEAALAGLPMVVLYRTGFLSYQLARRLVKLDRIALVNLVAERGIVPELIQGEAEPARLADAMRRLLDDGQARGAQREAFAEIREKLGSLKPGAEVAEMAGRILESP